MSILEDDPFATNKHALDYEWERQSQLMDYYGLIASDVSKEVDAKIAMYNQRKAKIALEYRKGERKIENIPKLTEGVIKEAVEADDELYALLCEINDKKYDLSRANNAVRSLSHKKHALEHLQDLYKLRYFSEPRQKTDRKTEEADEEQLEMLQDKIFKTREETDDYGHESI